MGALDDDDKSHRVGVAGKWCGAQWYRLQRVPNRPPDGVLTRKGLSELTSTELKKVTNCSLCGKRGHWKGDPECDGVPYA